MVFSVVFALFSIASAATPTRPLRGRECVKVGGCVRDDYLGYWTVYSKELKSSCHTLTYTVSAVPNEFRDKRTLIDIKKAGGNPQHLQVVRFTEACINTQKQQTTFTYEGVPVQHGNYMAYSLDLGSRLKIRMPFVVAITKVWTMNGKVVAAAVEQPMVHDYVLGTKGAGFVKTLWIKNGSGLSEAEII